MKPIAWIVGVLAAAACGGGTSPKANPFPGTCLEALFNCFAASGTGTCSYDRASRVAALTFSGGARITSASDGTQPNRCFAPAGSLCFTATKINDSLRDYSGQGVSASVTDLANGSVEVRCSGATTTLPRPAYNPAEEDLRRCVTP
jgi:hypothetical protein